MSTKRQWAIAVFTAWLFIAIGYVLHGDPSPTTPKARTVVRMVPMPAQTVTRRVDIPTIPDSCATALRDLAQLQSYANTIIDMSGSATDALQDAFVAIATKDVAKINAAQTRLHKLDSSLTEPAQGYDAILKDSQSATASCLKQIGD